jgi:hypothetical protein
MPVLPDLIDTTLIRDIGEGRAVKLLNMNLDTEEKTKNAVQRTNKPSLLPY